MPRAQGQKGPTEPKASELKAFKIYISANSNYLKY
jgi:hypothetical protein